MRQFGFINPDFIESAGNTFLTPEGSPLYTPSPIDNVIFDELPDGSKIFCDITQILLNQEKFRRLLGDANIQKIIDEMHPTMSTPMDGMTDDQRFDAVISRHCQTMSERQAVLSELASRYGDVKQMLSEIQKETAAETAKASAPAAAE